MLEGGEIIWLEESYTFLTTMKSESKLSENSIKDQILWKMDEINIPTEKLISKSEVEWFIRKIKNGKTPDFDDIIYRANQADL